MFLCLKKHLSYVLQINLDAHREIASLSDIATVDALIKLIVADRELGITARILGESQEIAALSPNGDALQP